MSTFDAVKRGLTVLLAAGGLAGPVAVIAYSSSRASADDLAEEIRARAVLEARHNDLAAQHEDERREVRRRLERLDAKQDRMLELLEHAPRRRGQ